jgi:outer membrane protein assembly factor BamB
MIALFPLLTRLLRLVVAIFAPSLPHVTIPALFGAEPATHLIASTESDWPQFRGPRRDGICDERNLLSSWPGNGPKSLWSANAIGRGYSSPIIAGDRLFITGDVGDELQIFALDLTGEILWKVANGAAWKEQFPGARASVTCSAGRIYHQNAHGRLVCLDARDGKELWSLNVLERFGGQNITWGLSECLLVDDQAVYVTTGGADALLVALDKQSGEVRWKSPPLRDAAGDNTIENASYASPILVRFADRRLLIGCSLRYLYCADADTGAMQWTRRFPTSYSVIAAMPALVGDSVFMTAPHGKGGRLFQLQRPRAPDASIDVVERWSTPLDTLQGGVVPVRGKLIGAYYPGRKGWAAIDAKTGAVVYDAPQLIKGAALYADERVYALCEDGWMLLLEPTEEEFKVHGRFRVTEAANDAWAHPVIHRGRLYLRYHDALHCYDIRQPVR